jgi:hypothetical protein
VHHLQPLLAALPLLEAFDLSVKDATDGHASTMDQANRAGALKQVGDLLVHATLLKLTLTTFSCDEDVFIQINLPNAISVKLLNVEQSLHSLKGSRKGLRAEISNEKIEHLVLTDFAIASVSVSHLPHLQSLDLSFCSGKYESELLFENLASAFEMATHTLPSLQKLNVAVIEGNFSWMKESARSQISMAVNHIICTIMKCAPALSEICIQHSEYTLCCFENNVLNAAIQFCPKIQSLRFIQYFNGSETLPPQPFLVLDMKGLPANALPHLQTLSMCYHSDKLANPRSMEVFNTLSCEETHDTNITELSYATMKSVALLKLLKVAPNLKLLGVHVSDLTSALKRCLQIFGKRSEVVFRKIPIVVGSIDKQTAMPFSGHDKDDDAYKPGAKKSAVVKLKKGNVLSASAVTAHKLQNTIKQRVQCLDQEKKELKDEIVLEKRAYQEKLDNIKQAYQEKLDNIKQRKTQNGGETILLAGHMRLIKRQAAYL